MSTVTTRISWDGGLDLGTSGTATFDPPVDPGPTVTAPSYSTVQALVVDDTTTTGGISVPTVWLVPRTKRGYRILVGGKDVTYFRGVRTPLPSYSLMSPLLYGSGSISFPQIHAALEHPGSGALSWLTKFAKVRVQRLASDGTVAGTDFVGFIADFPPSGRDLTCTLGGEASGRAAMQDRPVPIFPAVTDVGHQVMEAIQHQLRLPTGNRPDTGINLQESGGMAQLDWLTETLAKAVDTDGTLWTVMPNSSGDYRMFRKDTTTIDATVYIDGYRVSESLKRDFSEEPNRVWAQGIDKDGRRIRFAMYPGLQNSTQSFPGTLSPGDSGDDVTALMWRLYTVGALDDVPLGATWTTDAHDPVTEAVKDVQDDNGLSQTGVVNAATWRAIFRGDNYTLRRSAIRPASQKTYTRAFLRDATGNITGRNPAYDRSRLLVDVSVDMGPGFARRQIKEWARNELAGDASNWVGTITVTTGAVIDGEHNPGDALNSTGLLDVRSLAPGMNLWLPNWDGGTLVHLSGVSITADSAELTVDTRARDTMKVWEVITRNRESRKSLNRQWIAQNRRSGVRDDTGAFYDGGPFGKIPRTSLTADSWTVIPTPGGKSGILNLVDLQTTGSAAKFGLAIFGQHVDDSWCNRNLGDPFGSGYADRVQARTQDWQDNRGLIDVFGDNEQPCGYWPRSHTGSDGKATDAPITGRYRNRAGLPYLCQGSPVLWIAIRPATDTTLEGGRVLDLLLDDGAG